MTRAIEIVRMVAPDARENYIAAFRNGDALLKAHDITTPRRLAHFLAQVLHETGGLTVERESGNYSAKRLLEIFGVGKHSAAVTPQEAERLAHDAEAIFERVYGIGNPVKSRELGNTKPGDGFRYRGGGILQTTGRVNYRDMGALCGVDFENQPELVVSAEHALKPALAEWKKGNLNQLADQDDILLITKRINGGTNGLAERRRWLARLRPLIKSVDFAEGASADTPPSGPTVGPDAAARRGTGEGLLRRAIPHIGEDYVNRQVPKDDANWKGPWDCAEFISWLVYQEAGILYGCVDNSAPPSEADAYTGAWRRDAERHGIMVSVEKAASTVGGIVLRFPPPGAMGHIAVCDGKGGTVEAKGQKFGVVADKVDGRTWHTGILIPGIDYGETSGTVSVRPPADIYARNAVNMDRAVVVELQKALLRKGFDPGEIDGDFGPLTEAAVIDFQQSEGLVVDGEVGRDTAAALGVTLTSAAGQAQTTAPAGAIERDLGKPLDITRSPDLLKSFDPKILASLGLGAGAMNPFVLLAAQVLPGIIQAVAGDKAGAIAQTVAKTVKDVTGKDTAEAAADKLRGDAAAVTTLQIKLAEIAAEQENARRQAHLDEIKVQIQAEARRQEQDLEKLRVAAEDTKSARTTWLSLAQAQVPMAWGAPVVSVVVTVGFFVFMAILMAEGLPKIKQDDGKLITDPNVMQIINIVVGALTTAFATVVSFWLGSSQGSRLKDVAAIKREDEQVGRAGEAAASSAPARVTDIAKPKPGDQLNRCLEVVLLKETAVDSAASTRYGLTREEVAETLKKKDLSAEDFQKLTREEAAEIYRVRYWNVLNCDKLPVGVDLVALDVAAEGDVVRAAKLLQDVLGVKEDGSIGPVTLGALQHQTPRTIVTRLSELRRERLRTAQTGATAVDFTRIDDVERAAREMIDRAADK